MQANDIFCKTRKGQTEIETRSHGLPMQHRRVLILVNGSNDINELKRLSLNDNAPAIVAKLISEGFVEPGTEPSASSTTVATDYASLDAPG